MLRLLSYSLEFSIRNMVIVKGFSFFFFPDSFSKMTRPLSLDNPWYFS